MQRLFAFCFLFGGPSPPTPRPLAVQNFYAAVDAFALASARPPQTVEGKAPRRTAFILRQRLRANLGLFYLREVTCSLTADADVFLLIDVAQLQRALDTGNLHAAEKLAATLRAVRKTRGLHGVVEYNSAELHHGGARGTRKVFLFILNELNDCCSVRGLVLVTQRIEFFFFLD